MTARDRAIQLYELFRPLTTSGTDGLVGWHRNTKDCAIKCVNEMLALFKFLDGQAILFYVDVKSELEKM